MMSNNFGPQETRLFNRFSLRAMREMLLEADRETTTSERESERGRVDSEGVPSTQLSIVHEAQILHAPKLYLLHKTAIKSEMDAERCVLCACSAAAAARQKYLHRISRKSA